VIIPDDRMMGFQETNIRFIEKTIPFPEDIPVDILRKKLIEE
jgi:hypothetical protein